MVKHLLKRHTAAETRWLQISIINAAQCIFKKGVSQCFKSKLPLIRREPCMAYLSKGDEFQAFWYEMACQIKTGQNIYIELCTLHGNHNSYAETQSTNACSPQLLVCVCATHSASAQTRWGSLLLNGFKTDTTGNANRLHFCLFIDCT